VWNDRLDACWLDSIVCGSELQAMPQQLVDHEDNVLPRLLTLPIAGAKARRTPSLAALPPAHLQVIASALMSATCGSKITRCL
jgi:hypothetical protein